MQIYRMPRAILGCTLLSCILLAGCNSAVNRVGILTPEEQAVLYSPDLTISVTDLGGSSLATSAAPACGNVSVIYNITKTSVQKKVISQQQAITTYGLANVNAINRLKTAIKNEYGDQFSFCWTGITEQVAVHPHQAFGRFANVYVTLTDDEMPTIPTAWDTGMSTMTFTYLYGNGYEAVIHENLETGWLTRINRPANDKTKVLDYPLMGYWRGTYKFSDMVSFATYSEPVSIRFPKSLGIEPLATTLRPAINIPNAPRISILDPLKNKTSILTAKWVQECDNQSGPFQPCPPQTPTPPTPVPTPPPPTSPEPTPTTCQKENCTPKLGLAALNTALLVYSATDTVAKYTVVYAACFTPLVVTAVPCAVSSGLAVVSTAASATATYTTGTTIGDFLACRINNNNNFMCH
jgi:hypothetical protein